MSRLGAVRALGSSKRVRRRTRDDLGVGGLFTQISLWQHVNVSGFVFMQEFGLSTAVPVKRVGTRQTQVDTCEKTKVI